MGEKKSKSVKKTFLLGKVRKEERESCKGVRERERGHEAVDAVAKAARARCGFVTVMSLKASLTR